MIRYFYANTTNPKIETGNRIAVVTEGEILGKCCNCHKKITYSDKNSKLMNESIVDLACSIECCKKAGWFAKN